MKKKQMQKFGNIQVLKNLMPTRSLFRQRLKFVLAFLSLCLLILAAARLQFANGKLSGGDRRNVEVVAVVDVSNSMLCNDVAPTRLDRAKALITQMIDNSPSSKLGIVEFAGLSVTKMPLTSDYGSAKMFINSMSVNDISTQGTAIGMALVQAQRCFSKEDNIGRVILLITDAENHEDDAVKTAEEIAKSGIQVLVVGVGSEQGALLQIGDSLLKDNNGAPVITKLDIKTAEEVAKVGKGKFFKLTNIDDTVKHIVEEIEKISTGNVDAKSNAVFSDQFETFAFWAFILLLIEYLIMERKNHMLEKLNLLGGLKKSDKENKGDK